MILKQQLIIFISAILLLGYPLQIAADHQLVDSNNEIINVADDVNENKHNTQHFFDNFLESDLREFLEDHNIPTYNEKSSDKDSEGLKKYCSEKWHELFSSEGYENMDYSSWFSHLKDSLSLGHKDKSENFIGDLKNKVLHKAGKSKPKDISEWLFNTWDIPSLKSFLKENNIYTSQELKSRDDLIKICKDTFQDLSDKIKSSGYYISDKYFSKWTKEDLENWLNKNNVKFDADDKLENLRKLVRSNIYKASEKLKKSKNDFLSSIDIDSYGGAILSAKDSVDEQIKVLTKNLSKTDLKKWLELHDIELSDISNISDKDFKKLLKSNKYVEYLSNDITSYLSNKKEEAEKSGNYLLEKSSKQIQDQYDNVKKTGEKAGDVIDDYTSWSVENLQKFEESLNKEFGFYKSKLHNNKDQIVDYIQKLQSEQTEKFDNYYKSFSKNILPDKINNLALNSKDIGNYFDKWSFENLQKWVNDKSSKTDTYEQLLEKAKKKLNFGKPSKKDWKFYWNQAYNSLSKDELVEYLKELKEKSFLNQDSESLTKLSKEELFDLVKENTLSFISNGHYNGRKNKSLFGKAKAHMAWFKNKIPLIRNI
ncbi:hypothetical protein QEN19_003543 [Hanseniaspora menglaensis]